MMRYLFVIALIFWMVGAAAAQWIYQGSESAFGNGGLHVAVIALGQYGFGLRCRNEVTELMYMTPDTSFDRDAYKLANLSRPVNYIMRHLLTLEDQPPLLRK